MTLPETFSKAKDLQNALCRRNFAKVKQILEDPTVPVNLKFESAPHPLIKAISSHIKTFLACSRIDWLAPT